MSGFFALGFFQWLSWFFFWLLVMQHLNSK